LHVLKREAESVRVAERQHEAAPRGGVGLNDVLAALAPVVHGDDDAAKRLRGEQLEPAGAGQTALVQSRAVACEPGVDDEQVRVDQIQSIQLRRELAATKDTCPVLPDLGVSQPELIVNVRLA
jgi:hypothetical protein